MTMIEVIKQAAVEAVENGKPSTWDVGVVVSKNPLKIKTSNGLMLTSGFLLLTPFVKNHDVVVEVEGEPLNIKVKNELSVNDKVILVRQQGGQKFIVLCSI